MCRRHSVAAGLMTRTRAETWEPGRASGGRNRLLFRLLRVSEHFLADDAFRGFVQVLVQRALDLEKLGPQGVADKGFRCSNDDGGVPLARIAIGPQPVNDGTVR